MMTNHSYSTDQYSVLMSVYSKDRTDYIAVSIDSILAQTVLPEQFVIVFDGPVPEQISLLIDEYSAQHPKLFTLVRLNENSGLPTALNKGLEVCRNELVARMDSDDYSLPARCEKQLDYFKKNSRLALVGTDTQYFKETIDDVSPEVHYHAYTDEEIKHVLRRNSPFGHPTVMFRKSIVYACGGYDPILKRSQDYDLFSKMIHNGYEATNIPEVLLYYRVGDNMMKRNMSKESCRARCIIQKRIYQRKQCSLSDLLYINLAMAITRLLPVSLYTRLYSIVKQGRH